MERAYEEGGVQYYDVTFTEYGNTETYMTKEELKKVGGAAAQQEEENKPPPGSFAAALAAKGKKLNQTGLKSDEGDSIEINVSNSCCCTFSL